MPDSLPNKASAGKGSAGEQLPGPSVRRGNASLDKEGGNSVSKKDAAQYPSDMKKESGSSKPSDAL